MAISLNIGKFRWEISHIFYGYFGDNKKDNVHGIQAQAEYYYWLASIFALCAMKELDPLSILCSKCNF